MISKLQSLCGSKNSKEAVLQICVLQSNMWIFHFAQTSIFQPETIQSEHKNTTPLIVSRFEDFQPNEYFEIGDKIVSRKCNNLAALFFYCRLQLIQNFLTNGLFPLPRSPSNFEFCKIKSGRGAACWCQTFSKISSNKNNKRRNLSKGENCALLNYYTASSGNPLPTFRDNLSVSSSRVKKSSSLKVRQITCPETSVRNYHYSLHYKPEELSYHLLRFGSLKLHLSKSVTPLK